ncbi:MAG: 60S ribosomal export protein NMD3 [Methanotrichaceae archaeon]
MKLNSVCPRCGRSSRIGLCDQCRLESMILLDCSDRIEVILCSICGAQLIQGKWQLVSSPIEDLVFEAAKNAIKVHKDIENPQVTLTINQKNATQYFVEVSLTGEFEGLIAKEECSMIVTVRRIACDRCSRMAGRYYEAIVQIRGKDRLPSQQELNECTQIAGLQTEKSLDNGDQMSFIQDIKKVKGGIDIVVGSTQQGRHIAKSILDKFGGRIQESYKLIGRKEGKDVYRTNILVRLPRFEIGDILRFKRSILEVIGFDRKKTICISFGDKNNCVLSEDDSDEAQVLGNRSEVQKSIIVAEDEAVLEILDPDSYRTVSVSRPKRLEVVLGQEIDVLRSKEDLILLPSL